MTLPGAWETAKLIRLGIMIPHTKLISMKWAIHTFRGLQMPPGTQIITLAGQPIDIARENMVRDQLAKGADWLLFVDSDTYVPKDAVMRLFRTADMGYKMVSGMYFAKKPGFPKLPCAWIKNPKDSQYWTIDPKQNPGLIEVDAVGMGCCLIHKSIFQRLKPPWFLWSHDRYHPDKHELMQPPFSEDFYFCRRVREELKETIVLDMDLRCTHEAVCEIDENGNIDVSQG
jgi:hypothetical protein